MRQTENPNRYITALVKLHPDSHWAGEYSYAIASYNPMWNTPCWHFGKYQTEVQVIGWIELDKILLLLENRELIQDALENKSINLNIASQMTSYQAEKENYLQKSAFIQDLLKKID